MRRIDRYIFGEILAPTLVALLALTFMVVARELGVLLELILRGTASWREFWMLTAALVPGALTFTIPIAVLVGVLSGFSRLSSDSESVALGAVGISIRQILRPVLLLGVLAWTLNLAISVWLAPHMAARLVELTQDMALMRQIPLEIAPRVFNEDLEGFVLFVRDASPDGREWSGVFLADLGDTRQQSVMWAESGRFSQEPGNDRFEITLENGGEAVAPLGEGNYRSSTWQRHILPVPIPRIDAESVAEATPQQISTGRLLEKSGAGDASFAEEVELHRRLALPFASIAFVLLGLPLGISTRRGGRSAGLVLSAALMLAYYAIFIGGTGTASESAVISPLVGTWAANLGFLILGLVLLWRAERVGGGPAGAIRLPFAPGIGSLVRRIPDRIAGLRPRAAQHAKWVRILDLYVIRGFLFYFLLVSVAFAALVVVITLFELLPDIAEHDAGVGLVSVYFAYYLPQVVYLITPLAILVAVFITLGSLTRSNETMAARAGAISLYRLSWPLLGVAILFSAGVYLMGDYLLPYTNQRQDAYRDAIKGRAPQTYLDPLRKWMVGSRNQIYFYNYFDPEQNSFADLSVFDFDQNQSLVSWTFASRVTPEGDGWRFQNGWARSLEPGLPPGYRAFADERFGALVDPPDYFKREIRLASQMNYPELADHIEELRRAGFEVGRLTVELYRKLSYPLVSVIMAMIAIPFALSTGRRGAFFGIGIAIVIGITYWAAFELLEKLGGMGQISPPIAAWFPNLIFGFGGIWMLLKVRT